MTEALNEDVRRLIDGELDAMEVRRVLHEAADDVAARDLLRMEFRMRRVFEEGREAAWAVPEGFVDRVMLRVRHRSVEAPSSSAEDARRASFFGRIVDALLTAQPVMFRPAYALGVALLLVVGLFVLSRQGLPYEQKSGATESAYSAEMAAASPDDNLLVPFVYVSAEASSVAVAGDFNEWEPTRLQRKELDGQVVWTGLVPVPRGEHRYMFVVDGNQWESDPLATVHRDDGFGNANAVLAL